MAVAGDTPGHFCARHRKSVSKKKRGTRLIALGIALAVNGAALIAFNVAMVDGAERDLLTQQEPERVVITAPRREQPGQDMLATQNCPGRKAL
jgi:hypothetical protein